MNICAVRTIKEALPGQFTSRLMAHGKPHESGEGLDGPLAVCIHCGSLFNSGEEEIPE